ncbi:MAG TPA: hypothetical protein VGR94_05545 [Candidatus Acidoferrales bacterium]|nr:hypothetical protein [Candidatus Acidoferrales bacterium]
MKNKFLCAISLAVGLCGCGAWLDSTNPNVSTNADDYVGAYVSMQKDISPGGLADFVILEKGGSAIEITFSRATGQLATVQTTWRFERGFHQEDVVIGNRGYPIEHSPPDVRLGINSDLDQYYERVHYEEVH